MKCHVCGVNKLSREYPQEPLTEQCDHACMVCMSCVIKCVNQQKKCPDQTCQVDVSPDSPTVDDMKHRLLYLFPVVKSEYKPIAAPPSGETGANIRVSTLTGESIVVPYDPALSIVNLKKIIKQKAGHDEIKQRLLFNGKDLEIQRKNGALMKLHDYGIQAHQTVHLVVLLYAIPDKFDHVIFDLFWGYPSSGADYLDASCLAFSGQHFVEVVDWSHTNSKCSTAISHSGDVMDDYNQKGHHTIDVKLKGIPQKITHLFFTLSAWSSPNISRYPNPSLKFFEASNKNKDLCSTSFQHANHSQAVVMCFVSRHSGSWQIYKSGKLSAGNASNYNPLEDTIREIIGRGV